MAKRYGFEKPPVERPDPAKFLRKREGSPGGLKRAPGSGSPEQGGGLIPAARPACGGSPSGSGSPPRSSLFWRMYERGDLPCTVDQARSAGKNGIKWKTDVANIDLHYYVPIFVDGLLETQEPFRMLARRGVEQLVMGAGGDRLLPVIPQLIMGMRAALSSPSADVMMAAMHALELLVNNCEAAGPALVPYYRQLLPPLGRHINDNLNIGDRIDYGQAKHKGSLGDVVLHTLQLLERAGGSDAFLHIKYYIPTYQSVCRPSRLTRKP